MTHHSRPRKREDWLLDWLLYVAIAVLVVISVWTFAIHQAKIGGSAELPLKWLGFSGMTTIIFCYVIRAYRRSWRKREFWVMLGLFFAVHSGLGIFVLLKVPTVPLVTYAVLTPIEYAIVTAYLRFFLDR